MNLKLNANVTTIAQRLGRIVTAASLAAVAFTTFAIAAPTPASAACQRYVGGTWATSQGNNYHVTFNFGQNGSSVYGSASIPEHERTRAGYTSSVGSVSGSVENDYIDVVVTWSHPNGPVKGRYYGRVSSTELYGSGYNLANPVATSVDWHGTGRASCR